MNSIKIILLLIAITIIFSSFIRFGPLEYLIYKPHVRVYREILHKYEKEVLKPHNIKIRGASYKNHWPVESHLHRVGISSVCPDNPDDIDKIRVIAVNMMEKLFEYFYNDPRVLKYIEDGFVTNRFFGVSVMFAADDDITTCYKDQPYIGSVSVGSDIYGSIYYIDYDQTEVKKDSSDGTYILSEKRFYREGYEEGFQIVKDNNELTW